MSAGLLVTRELRPVYLGHGVVGRRGGVEEQRDLLKARSDSWFKTPNMPALLSHKDTAQGILSPSLCLY